MLLLTTYNQRVHHDTNFKSDRSFEAGLAIILIIILQKSVLYHLLSVCMVGSAGVSELVS